MSVDLAAWRASLEETILRERLEIVDRVELLPEVASTQDAARAAAARAGLVVAAARQTAGRGRLGRTWVQKGDLGLALTLVVDASRFTPEHVSLAAGVACARAAEQAIHPAPVGLCWPNDVVSSGRKLAGVLIEGAADFLFVGFGVNLLQGPGDWPPDLRTRAVSIAELGGRPDRVAVSCGLLKAFDSALRGPRSALLEEWSRRDALTGRDAEFVHDGRRYKGRVEGIDPTLSIRVRLTDGTLASLPARTTTVVN